MCLKSNKYNSSCNSMLKSILPSFTCKRTETHFNNLVFLFSPGWTIAMLRPMCDAYMSLQNCKHSCHMLSHTTPNITLQFNNTKQCTAVTTLTNYICTEPIKRFGYTKLKQHVWFWSTWTLTAAVSSNPVHSTIHWYCNVFNPVLLMLTILNMQCDVKVRECPLQSSAKNKVTASHLNHIFCRVQWPLNCGVPSPFIHCLTLNGKAPQSFETVTLYQQW